jgi:hypothetical protein
MRIKDLNGKKAIIIGKSGHIYAGNCINITKELITLILSEGRLETTIFITEIESYAIEGG